MNPRGLGFTFNPDEDYERNELQKLSKEGRLHHVLDVASGYIVNRSNIIPYNVARNLILTGQIQNSWIDPSIQHWAHNNLNTMVILQAHNKRSFVVESQYLNEQIFPPL